MEQWQIDLNDDGKLRQKYINKKINAIKENLICELSFYEYCLLIKEAGLKSSDIGFSGNHYVLARYNDSGNYTYENCRFITNKENIAERKTSEKQIEASKRNIKVAQQKYNNMTEEEKRLHSQKIKEGIKNSKKIKKIRKKKNQIKEEKESKKDPRHSGEHNSHYGTMWITNGIINKIIKKEETIPDGWKKGRVGNFISKSLDK